MSGHWLQEQLSKVFTPIKALLTPASYKKRSRAQFESSVMEGDPASPRQATRQRSSSDVVAPVNSVQIQPASSQLLSPPRHQQVATGLHAVDSPARQHDQRQQELPPPQRQQQQPPQQHNAQQRSREDYRSAGSPSLAYLALNSPEHVVPYTSRARPQRTPCHLRPAAAQGLFGPSTAATPYTVSVKHMVRQPQVGRRGGTAFAAKQPLQSTRPLGSVRRHGPSSSVRYVLPDRPASLQQLQQGVLHAPAPDNAIRMLDEANVLEAKANVIRQTALQEMARNKRSGPVNYEAERQYQELIAQHERLQKGQAAVAAQAPTPAVIDMASPFGRDASAAQPPAQAAARATEAAQLAAARLVAEQSREQELERRQRKEQQRLRAKSADMFGGPSLQKLFARCDAALSTSGKSLAETQERDREMRLDLAESERQTLAALREAREQQRQRLQKAAPAWLRPAAAPLVPKPRAQPARRAAPPPPAQEECVDLVSSSEEEGEGETAHQEGDGLYGERGEYDQEAEEEEEAQSSYSQQAEEELSEAMAASVSLSASESEGPELARPYQPTAAHKRLYRQALDKGDPEEILMKHKNSNIDITRRLIKCMKPPEWLNDEVMNVYMGLLQDRDTRRRKAGRGPKCHFFNSFFINKLFLDQKPAAYAYANVRRWTNPKRLATWGQASASVLDCDVIIMPVHLGLHWTCAVVRLTDRELVYYDSMKGERADIMEALRQWVADEFKDKRNQDVDTSTWPIRYEKDIPQQHNGSDCGAFTLAFAEFEGRGASLAGAFAQEHMNAYRVKLTGEILSSCIST